MDKNSEYFQVGGSLSKDSPSYIERPADSELIKNLERNEVCLVIAPRQTGKTSLMNHAIKKLDDSGIKMAIVDLQSMGELETAEKWFSDLIYQLERSLGLQTDVIEWWQTHNRIGVNRRFITFLEDVVLDEIKKRVVIFFDEIDSVKSLKFSDDFFTTIREVVNARANNDTLKRINFVLMGMVSPSDFISNRSRTPFNVGKQINLIDFDKDSLVHFKNVLGDGSEEIINRIFYWADGQPFMVQRFAEFVYSIPEPERKPELVDVVVKESYLEMKIDRDTHLKYIRDYLLYDKRRRRLLKIYGAVLQGNEVTYTEKQPLHSKLLLSGVVKVTDGKLASRNRIYQGVFNDQWIKENTPKDKTKIVAYSASSILVSLLLWFFIIQPMLFPEFIKRQKHSWLSEDLYYTVEKGISFNLAFPSQDIKRVTNNGKSVEMDSGNNKLNQGIKLDFDDLKVGENLYLIHWFEGIWQKNYETKINIVYYPDEHWETPDDLEMAVIPEGCFMMGSEENETERNKDEHIHEVCLDEFEMGKYEVTQKQWVKIMGYNPSYFKKGDRYPVEWVSWEDIQEFLRRYNKLSGFSYRLPTEAEWEYAARAGVKTKYYSGDSEDDLGRVGWYETNSENSTHEVGLKQANDFGLYDMHGNVWEWCLDWYERGYYLKSPKDNPIGPSTGSNRVLRGGSWFSFAWFCRSAYRYRSEPGNRNSFAGFRLLLPRSVEKAVK